MEQFIGLGVLVVIAAAAPTLAVQLLRLYVRARYEGTERDFWNRERRRLNRALFGLVVAVTLLVGFPSLDFDSNVEDIVGKIATLVAAGAVVLLAFRAIDIFTDVLARRAALTESRADDQLIPLLNTTLKGFVIVVGALFVLSNLNVNVTSLVAGLGLGGLAIALAAQDTIATSSEASRSSRIAPSRSGIGSWSTRSRERSSTSAFARRACAPSTTHS